MVNLKRVTDCIVLPEPIADCVKGLVECAHGIALQQGKKDEEAVRIAADRLENLLDDISKW